MFWNRQAERDAAGTRALGWASMGIALFELIAPRKVQQLLGIDDHPEHRGVLRVLGVREFLHGLGILTETRPSHELKSGIWSRVGGDVLDTAVLGIAATKTKVPARFAAVAAGVAAIGLLDALYAARVQRHDGRWS